MNGHKDVLLGVLQDYAPNGMAQEQCAEIVRAAESEGATPRNIDRLLSGLLVDGLAYGNWPWL